MQGDSKGHSLFLLTLVLFVVTITIVYVNWSLAHRELTFAMLDVGQGDSLFIESKEGVQVLVDGGPPGKLLGKLSQVTPFYDRSIDLIIITNPDLDHIGGFIDLLKNYKVGAVLEPGTINDSTTYRNLKEEIKNKNIPLYLAREGMKINLGQSTYLKILFPDRDVSTWSINDGSVIAQLISGDTKVMLTGDATMKTERILLDKFSRELLDVDVLKVGHHGSHSSTSDAFVETLSPSYALISDGRDNKYGHPHEDVLNTLKEHGAKVYRTDLLGSIIMRSDGVNETFSFIK